MPKIYVVGATLPAGGAHMSYRLGALISRHFGHELVNVEVARPAAHSLFTYEMPSKTISLDTLDQEITDRDILIANPSFSSFLFGVRLPGRKIMYAQGFNTHGSIDGHFDLYVSTSSAVARYLESVWSIRSPVVAPFIDIGSITPLEWRERPVGSALVFIKQRSPENHMIYSYLKEVLKIKAPHIQINDMIEGRNIPHAEFLARIASVRYLINMTIAEGFGLVPLEAMALGTMVTGLDGLAGRDYMRYGENCLVASFKELRAMPDIVFRAMSDDKLAESCVAEAYHTAAQHSYEHFEKAWLLVLKPFLQHG